jgi:hypothetical protein
LKKLSSTGKSLGKKLWKIEDEKEEWGRKSGTGN